MKDYFKTVTHYLDIETKFIQKRSQNEIVQITQIGLPQAQILKMIELEKNLDDDYQMSLIVNDLDGLITTIIPKKASKDKVPGDF